jgi:uncharacterized SAM-dependent methyltransferase
MMNGSSYIICCAATRARTSSVTCARVFRRNRKLFPKYFYDALGSQLFEAICQLPEYYLARAEDEIFATHARDIVEAIKVERKSAVTLLKWAAAARRKRAALSKRFA